MNADTKMAHTSSEKNSGSKGSRFPILAAETKKDSFEISMTPFIRSCSTYREAEPPADTIDRQQSPEGEVSASEGPRELGRGGRASAGAN
jgi:hypothetical protein